MKLWDKKQTICLLLAIILLAVTDRMISPYLDFKWGSLVTAVINILFIYPFWKFGSNYVTLLGKNGSKWYFLFDFIRKGAALAFILGTATALCAAFGGVEFS